MAEATKRYCYSPSMVSFTFSITIFDHKSHNHLSLLVWVYLFIYLFFWRYAVVTGANKGIGFEAVRQLASNRFIVVLTARDEKRGLEALGKLKDSGLSVVFHQLDVSHPASIASLADFIKTHFGKLDVLVWLEADFFKKFCLFWILFILKISINLRWIL